MNTRIRKLSALLLATLLLAASLCACAPKDSDVPAPEDTTQDEAQNTDSSDQIADASEKLSSEDVLDESMIPVAASDIKDGTYEIAVDSSSAMFNIVACTLTVSGDQMSADMTMSGKGYRYIYLGTPEEAVEAASESFILPQVDEEGAHHYVLPVEALDAGIDCAAFSDNKEKWYDRVLVFRASSLDISDYEDGFLTTAQSLNLSDGSYTCEVSLSGGSGKATVESPAKITVQRGIAYAELVWSSDKYDFMVVDDEQIMPLNQTGNSVFLIPVGAFDFNLPVQADTIAMSTPHLIDYTLRFDSTTLQ